MRQILKLHPDSRCDAVTALEVEVMRPGPGRLALRYIVTGAIGELSLPAAAAAPERTDGLWRHTCFEAFVRPGQGEGYWEFNFAPSTRWAAYEFDGHRAGMRPAEGVGAPRIAVSSTDESFELSASVALAAAGAWRVGLSAVIEAADGGMSYWALAHPRGKPDFHHADCFALELPASGRP